jgi:hypothetical protein
MMSSFLTITGQTLAEGNSGTQQMTFTVTRNGGGNEAFDVNFATSDVSATTADNDYVATSGTLHFSSTDQSKTIQVTINGDTTPEMDEIFSVNLSNATNGVSIVSGTAFGTNKKR